MADTSQGEGWWQASDMKWYPPQQASSLPNPHQATGAACKVCGAHALHAREQHITEKRRVKFGVFWVLFTLLTAGIGFLFWLAWPRTKVITGVDRWLECSVCGARQT